MCAGGTLCLFWALHHMKSIQKDNVGKYRIHDNAPTHATWSFWCCWQLEILFLGASWTWCLYILSCSLVALHPGWIHVCTTCVGAVVSCAFSTLVCDLECYNIFLLLLYPSCFYSILLAGDAVARRWFIQVSQHILPFLLIPTLKPCHVSSTSATETALLPLVCLLTLLWCCYWCHLWGQELFLHCYCCVFNITFVVYVFQNSTFLTSIWSYRCLLQSEHGLESTYALKRKCTKVN